VRVSINHDMQATRIGVSSVLPGSQKWGGQWFGVLTTRSFECQKGNHLEHSRGVAVATLMMASLC
jgi:hypothetical protein